MYIYICMYVCTTHHIYVNNIIHVYICSRALSDFDGVFFGTKSINRDNFRTNPNPSL